MITFFLTSNTLSAVDLLVRVFAVTSGQPHERVLEDLPAIDLLLNAAACDETIDDHVLLLTDAERPVHCLGICCRVPAWIN